MAEATDQTRRAIARADERQLLDICKRLNGIARELVDYHKGTEFTGLLRAALEAARLTVQAMPPSCDKRWAYLWYRAKVSSILFECTLERDLIDEAVKAMKQVSMITTPDSHISWPQMRLRYAEALATRYRHYHEEDDIDNAVRISKEAMVEVGQDDDTFRMAEAAGRHGDVLATWALARLGRWDELRESIAFNKKAIKLCERCRLSNWRFQLGRKLRNLFLFSGHVEDIDEAIAVTNESLSRLGKCPGWYAWTAAIDSLGASYAYKYKAFGNMDDLSRSIQMMREVCNSLTEYSPKNRVLDSNLLLSRNLEERYKMVDKDLDDLDEAIEHGMVAYTITSPADPCWVEENRRLTALLREMCRHHKLNNAEDNQYYVDLLIEWLKQRIVAGIPDEPERIEILGELTWGLRLNFRLNGRRNDLVALILGLKTHVRVLPKDSPHYLKQLRRLARYVCEAYDTFHEAIGVNETIALCCNDIPAGRPLEGPEIVKCYDALCDLYMVRYQYASDPEDLCRAAEAAMLVAEAKRVLAGDDGDEDKETADRETDTSDAGSTSEDSSCDESEDEEAGEEEAGTGEGDAGVADASVEGGMNEQPTDEEDTNGEAIDDSSEGHEYMADLDQWSGVESVSGSGNEGQVPEYYFLPRQLVSSDDFDSDIE